MTVSPSNSMLAEASSLEYSVASFASSCIRGMFLGVKVLFAISVFRKNSLPRAASSSGRKAEASSAAYSPGAFLRTGEVLVQEFLLFFVVFVLVSTEWRI